MLLGHDGLIYSGMHLIKLDISNFRNFLSAEIQYESGINIFHGQNGSGKTNLIEANFMVLLGRSARGANDAVMLNEKSEHYRLEAEVVKNDKGHIFAIAYQKGGRKKITKDKIDIKIAELFRDNGAVFAAPSDIDILAGAPSVRREFLNVYISQISPTYLADLTEYQRILAQKNAFLKQNHAGDCIYNDLLVKCGARLMHTRLNFIKNISESAARYYGKISGSHKLEGLYRPSVALEGDDFNVNEIATAFELKLTRYKEREKIMQTALVGPHRDDIEFIIRDFPARTHGSQGELRTAAIALKLAVFDYIKDSRGHPPVLLLDEIFAELDKDRCDRLIESFGNLGQVFITTASSIPEKLSGSAKSFLIKDGAIVTQ